MCKNHKRLDNRPFPKETGGCPFFCCLFECKEIRRFKSSSSKKGIHKCIQRLQRRKRQSPIFSACYHNSPLRGEISESPSREAGGRAFLQTVHARYYDARHYQQGCRLSCFHKAVHYTHTFNNSTGGLLGQVSRQFYLYIYQQAVFLHQKYLPQALRRQLTRPRSFCRSHLQEKRHTLFP